MDKIDQLKEALNRLILESIHYRDTHRGEQFLNQAISDARAILAIQEHFEKERP